VIKREHIKQAIDAIGERAPEIGRALDELLGVGRIETADPSEATSTDTDFHFFFDKQKVRVKKFIFINEGTTPIERGLLIKYGELLRKRELIEGRRERDFLKAAREVRSAGLRLLVSHEIDAAVERAHRLADADSAGDAKDRIAALTALKSPNPEQRIPASDREAGVLFRGNVEDGRQALFIRFPFCFDALMQVADINLEFFHVRFLLASLLRGQTERLFACVVDSRIVGMLFLALKTALFYSGLEIKYIATLRGRRSDDEEPPPRGIGRFLVAGTWLLWKTAYARAREIVLDSEIGARRFYEHHGFVSKGPHRYVLSSPSPDLLRTILTMAENCPGLSPKVVGELAGLVMKRIKSLRRQSRSAHERERHAQVEAMAQTALSSCTYPAIATAATRGLLRCRRSLSELEHLLAVASQNPEVRKAFIPGAAPAVGVACDDRFTRHLENVFHLENAKRYEAIRSVLEDPSLSGKLKRIAPRPATPQELAWVHTPAYIARVAHTAGRPLTSFDLDTQTTAKSYETACLAAGAVFNLVEEIWSGRIQRGFAAIRPPGHHAEPDRGMGFCLFNNTALGARYLQHRHGLKRIMVVDIDAHHGNGAQSVFYDTDEVFCVSIHQFPGFPGTGKLGEVGRGKGEGYTVNVPLRKGHGDADFLRILHFLVRPLARAYQPEIILVPCGFDLWMHDRLAEMRVSAEGYGLMTALLADTAAEVCSGRIAFVMEGGYSAEGIRECGLKVLQSLCRPSPSNLESLHEIAGEDPLKLGPLKKAIEIQRRYWEVLK
jgi:acetoin utilization deacetylase AcuC-like enzyme/GNAT superfamily N-acetyltransferase